MLSNIRYRLTLFADYSNIYYSLNNTSKLIESFSDEQLFSSVLSETDNMGNRRNGIVLFNNERTFTVSIMSGRIDVVITSEEKEGFEESKLDLVRNKLTYAVKNIYDSFQDYIQDAYRMAWYTEYVYFEIDEKMIIDYKNRFIKQVRCIEGIDTSEIEIQYAAVASTDVIDFKERYNQIIRIERVFPQTISSSFYVDGYRISFDINTHQDNKKNRINIENIKEYIDAAIGFQMKLKGGFIDEFIF